MNFKKIIPLIALAVLASCGTTNTNNTNNSTNKNDEITDNNENDDVDIYEDYDDSNKETFDDITSEIDVSTIAESTYSISEGGKYLLTGENSNLSINVSSEEDVTLILSDVNITSTGESAPISVDTDGDFVLYLAANTKNYLKDSEANLSDGVLNVKGTNLNIEGEGYLIIDSLGLNTGDFESGKGIHNSKTLTIKDSHIIVNSSSDHALNGKGGIVLENAKLDLTSNKDAIHSKEGGLEMNDTTLVSSSYGDGIDVAGKINIIDSNCYITTTGEFILYDASEDVDGELYEDSKYILKNGEYQKISSDDMSRYSTRYYLNQKCKGIKSEENITIDGGKYVIRSTDDCIASDLNINIYDGVFSLTTFDQGINGDQIVNIGKEETKTRTEDFIIKINDSYEGIQGGVINFYDAEIYVDASDDGINATSDTLTDISMNFYNDTYVNVRAEGDGIDSNGDILLDGGTLIVFGPQESGNGALDFDGNFTVNSGEMIAISSIGMIENPNLVNQNIVYSYLNQSFSENDVVSLKIDDKLFSTMLPKSYNSLYMAVTSPDIKSGSSYEVLSGGVLSKDFYNNAFIGEANLNDSTSLYSGTISATTTSIGSTNQGGNRPGGPGGR